LSEQATPEDPNPYQAPLADVSGGSQLSRGRRIAFGCLVVLSLPFAIMTAFSIDCAVQENKPGGEAIIRDVATMSAIVCGAIAALTWLVAYLVQRRKR
jgi:hypothetical protein